MHLAHYNRCSTTYLENSTCWNLKICLHCTLYSQGGINTRKSMGILSIFLDAVANNHRAARPVRFRDLSKTLRFRDIQLFCFPVYRYKSSLALRSESSPCELPSLCSALPAMMEVSFKRSGVERWKLISKLSVHKYEKLLEIAHKFNEKYIVC